MQLDRILKALLDIWKYCLCPPETLHTNIPRLYGHGHRLTVPPALEGRNELQHGFPAANSKQVMHLMHLE